MILLALAFPREHLREQVVLFVGRQDLRATVQSCAPPWLGSVQSACACAAAHRSERVGAFERRAQHTERVALVDEELLPLRRVVPEYSGYAVQCLRRFPAVRFEPSVGIVQPWSTTSAARCWLRRGALRCTFSVSSRSASGRGRLSAGFYISCVSDETRE